MKSKKQEIAIYVMVKKVLFFLEVKPEWCCLPRPQAEGDMKRGFYREEKSHFWPSHTIFFYFFENIANVNHENYIIFNWNKATYPVTNSKRKHFHTANIIFSKFDISIPTYFTVTKVSIEASKSDNLFFLRAGYKVTVVMVTRGYFISRS